MSKKIKALLETCKKELKKYTKIFQESGDGIDPEEQKQLDVLLAQITLCEEKLKASETASEIPSPEGIVLPKQPKPTELSPLDLTSFDPSLVPGFDMSWTQDVNDWLDKNRLNLVLNLLKNTIPLLRKEVNGLENVKDKELKLYIKSWAKANHVFLETEEKYGKSDVDSAMDDFFAEFKKLGKFDWKFDGGSLKLDLVGQTAKFGYKHKDLEVSTDVSKDDVKVKVSGKVDDVTGTIEGKVKFDGSGGGSLSVNDERITGKVGVDVDKEGKVKGSASLKIADVLKFNSSSGSITASLSGNESSWSFSLELSTSGGKAAHLSRKAASEIKEVVNKASQALKEIYTILEKEDLRIENISAIKKQIDPHWKLVDKAITLLSKDIKKPSPKNEIFVSFGLSDSEPSADNPGGLVVSAGLTFTF